MLGFNLKLLGKKSKKNVLVSAGKISDKEKMFPALQKLSKLNVELFATPGTYRFLKQKGIDNQEIHKIADRREPNIRTFLDENRLDLIINVLTGDNDYDESSDSKLIRSLAIENGIPLITDVDVAIQSIDQLVKRDVEGFYRYKAARHEAAVGHAGRVPAAGPRERRVRQLPRPLRQGLPDLAGQPAAAAWWTCRRSGRCTST